MRVTDDVRTGPRSARRQPALRRPAGRSDSHKPRTSRRGPLNSLGNQIGLSSAIAHYLSGVTYTHLNQVGQTFQNQGAEQWRTYTWDTQTLRLNELFDQRYATANATVSDDTYSYTDAGQITEDSNRTEAASTDTQCYRYGLLDTLASAWTPASNDCTASPTNTMTMGGPAPYWTSYSNNPANNNRTSITTRTLNSNKTVASSVVATYNYPAAGATPGSGGTGAGGPNAVSSITYSNGAATSAYSYDLDGSTTSMPGHTIHYDANEHADSQTIAGKTETDVYDAGGALLLATNPTTGSTAFLGDTELHVAAAAGSVVSGSRTYTLAGQPIAERDTTAGVTGSKLYFTDATPPRHRRRTTRHQQRSRHPPLLRPLRRPQRHRHLAELDDRRPRIFECCTRSAHRHKPGDHRPDDTAGRAPIRPNTRSIHVRRPAVGKERPPSPERLRLRRQQPDHQVRPERHGTAHAGPVLP